MSLWLTIVAAGLVTFGLRLSLIAAQGHVEMPEWFTRGLNYVPVAVLSAIILPELLTRNKALDLSPANPRLLAGIVAAGIAWRTKNMWLTMAGGMVGLIVLQMIFPY